MKMKQHSDAQCADFRQKGLKNRMKHRIYQAAAVLLSAVLLAVSVHAAPKQHNWYCKASGNKQPVCDAQLSVIEQYHGYYVDKNHGDASEEKVTYLTFDAGYENGNIAKILDTLEAENVPAAFFVLGHLIEQNTDLVIRMGEEGHLVCNHTAKHKNMAKIADKDAFASELDALETLYREKTGKEMAKYYRPPEGSFTEENLKFADELGYKTVFWSLAYADWDNKNQPSAADAMEKLTSRMHNGAVILLHPTSSTNAQILGDFIRRLKEDGYRFGTLDELTQ